MVRRIVTAVIAFSALMFLYALYLAAFRRFWAFQELPAHLLPPGGAPHIAELVDTTEDIATRVAREVFGSDAWQTRAVISLHWAEQGVFLYANEYSFPAKTRMRLAPVSVVRTKEQKGGGRELLVLEATEAVLDFDRPISVASFSAARPVRARAVGEVHIAWNRGTPDPADDVDGYLSDLIFDRHRQLLWTTGQVRVTSDTLALTGDGGRITFVKDSLGELDVESVQITRSVRVEGLLDERARGMLAADGAEETGTPQKHRGREQYVAITCAGPLVMDAQRLQAIFHKDVQVQLQAPGAAADSVHADELRLSFARLEPTGPSRVSSAQASGRLRLTKAEAMGQPVVVESPSRKLSARATSMLYDATTRLLSLDGTTGVHASYGSIGIRVARLQLRIGTPGTLEGVAPGPGELVGKAGDDAAAPAGLTASWQEEARLEMIDGKHVVTLLGNVHVAQADKGNLSATKAVRLWFDRETMPRQPEGMSLPRRIEASGNVVLTTRDTVLRTELLTASLEPARPASREGGISSPDQDDHEALLVRGPRFMLCQFQGEGPAVRVRGVTPVETPSDSPFPAFTPASPPPAEEQAPPETGKTRGRRIEITAGEIRASVAVAAEKLIAREVWAERAVSIIEKGSAGEDEGLEIRGDTVHAKNVDGGYFFEVTGTPAVVTSGTLALHGKLIGLDQPSQVAWVRGEGRATFRTNVSLAPGAPSSDHVEVTWSNDMFFDGLVAEFSGSVRVQQGETTVTCERLEAHLSERVSLADERAPSSPTLARLVASGAVQLRRESGQGVTRVEGPRMVYTSTDQHVVIAGPGKFWMSSFGSPAPVGPSAASGPPRWSGTLVLFDRLMEIDQQAGVVKFLGRVRVWHAPVEGPNHEFSHAAPPSDAMSVACDQLELLLDGSADATAISGTGAIRQLVARGNAKIQGRGFYAYADVLKYDATGEEPKVIAETSGTGFATFYRQPVPGRRPDVLRARKITYWPQTGEFRQEGGIVLDVRGTGGRPEARR